MVTGKKVDWVGVKKMRTRTDRFPLRTFHVLTSPVLSSLPLRIEILGSPRFMYFSTTIFVSSQVTTKKR